MTLLLVSGAGGAGITTVAQGLARSLREEGYSTAEIDSSIAAPLGTSQVWSDAVSTFGVWLQSLGASTLAAQELEGLVGLNELITGVMVADAVRDRCGAQVHHITGPSVKVLAVNASSSLNTGEFGLA